ncbi:glycoside hydrolase family 27 protein [Rickenella mellea]|uniref:Alpha-galactosidase n=1 Tax=Rickenella mellea TaxID=50990 RepID=A0A4Y7QLK9_9AGAM|nr:glycoside hydrolase family 27 protein [Rickenella mellea]
MFPTLPLVLLAFSQWQSFVPSTYALNNGLARTPPMGWNPYNFYSTDATEAVYNDTAKAIVNLGLEKLGYNIILLEAGWQGTARDASGNFTWNTAKYPSGIPALGTLLHSLGLKLGVYSDGGFFSCDSNGGKKHWLGSIGHEAADAATFASWGMDYLKYDNCYSVNSTDFVDPNPPIPLEPHYTTMLNALEATKRPIIFAICEWGVQDPARWAPAVGNSWRISNDIGPPASWANFFRIINQLVPITGFAGPGAWNDLDMLEVGNSPLTTAEQQTHFAFWAAAKSPLIISTNMINITSTSLSILQNERLIAVNQDPLGKSIALKRRYSNDNDVWAGPLSDGSTVVIVVNWQNVQRSLTLNLADAGFTSATLMDLWSGSSLGKFTNTYTATVPAHGNLALKLTGGTAAPKPSFTTYTAAATQNIVAGGAQAVTVNTTQVVENIGSGGTLTFTGVDGGTTGGTKLVSINFINADVAFNNGACSNCRNAFVSVNNGNAVQVQFPLSGQSWNIVYKGYLVTLSGFKAGANNTIQFSNPTTGVFGPNLVQIGVQK